MIPGLNSVRLRIIENIRYKKIVKPFGLKVKKVHQRKDQTVQVKFEAQYYISNQLHFHLRICVPSHLL